MRATQKLALLDGIASTLSNRYDWDDIIRYLNHYDVRADDPQNYSSQSEYVKSHLHSSSANVLVEIAEDLELQLPASRRESLVPPKNWPDDKTFRLFISHLSKDKRHATRLRDCLVPLHISGFVAHQDIQPTLEWQREIERALNAMDAFVSIHTAGFSQSVWTQQEIGFAVARGVKIISLKFDEDPTGFISRQQALPRLNKTAEEIARELSGLLASDPLTIDRMASVKLSNKPKIDDEIPF
jgi:hypothetical protein